MLPRTLDVAGSIAGMAVRTPASSPPGAGSRPGSGSPRRSLDLRAGRRRPRLPRRRAQRDRARAAAAQPPRGAARRSAAARPGLTAPRLRFSASWPWRAPEEPARLGGAAAPRPRSPPAIAALFTFVGDGLARPDRSPTRRATACWRRSTRRRSPARSAQLQSLRVDTFQYYDDHALAVLALERRRRARLPRARLGADLPRGARRAPAGPSFPRSIVYLPLVGAVAPGALDACCRSIGTNARDQRLPRRRRGRSTRRSDITPSGLGLFAQLLGLPGALALALAIVLISLNAMRVGLLTRFMGVLGHHHRRAADPAVRRAAAGRPVLLAADARRPLPRPLAERQPARVAHRQAPSRGRPRPSCASSARRRRPRRAARSRAAAPEPEAPAPEPVGAGPVAARAEAQAQAQVAAASRSRPAPVRVCRVRHPVVAHREERTSDTGTADAGSTGRRSSARPSSRSSCTGGAASSSRARSSS